MRRMISQKDQNKVSNLGYENGRFGQYVEAIETTPNIIKYVEILPLGDVVLATNVQNAQHTNWIEDTEGLPVSINVGEIVSSDTFGVLAYKDSANKVYYIDVINKPISFYNGTLTEAGYAYAGTTPKHNIGDLVFKKFTLED